MSAWLVPGLVELVGQEFFEFAQLGLHAYPPQIFANHGSLSKIGWLPVLNRTGRSAVSEFRHTAARSKCKGRAASAARPELYAGLGTDQYQSGVW